MVGFWLSGAQMDPVPEVRSPSATGHEARLRELEHQVGRLMLLNQALWELLRERAKMTDAQLEAKAREVDLRDGVEDGKLTATPLRCPNCQRVSNSKHWKCLYCGQEFEKPVIG